MSDVIKLGEVKKNKPTTKKPTEVSGEYNFSEVIERNKQRDRMLDNERKRNNKSTKRTYLRRDD